MTEAARVQPATGELCLPLADDLLRGADAIAEFIFGSAKHRRKIYYYASDAKIRMPHFRIGSVICARKSTLLAWVEQQEGIR
jgi:hypothetical protein